MIDANNAVEAAADWLTRQLTPYAPMIVALLVLVIIRAEIRHLIRKR